MEGLQFQAATPPVGSDPARADIACFVGAVACRTSANDRRAQLARVLAGLGWSHPGGAPLPGGTGGRALPLNVQPWGDSGDSFSRWLLGLGWKQAMNATAGVDLFRRSAAGLFGDALSQWWTENSWLTPASNRNVADLVDLLDVPVPIDSWDAFDALFAWDERPLVGDPPRFADTALGAAVRRFFLQGGRKCYIVRIADPWRPLADAGERVTARARIFPDTPGTSPSDRRTWRGIAHLFGLPDVSFLCVPDLPDLFSSDIAFVMPETGGEGPEAFVECAGRTAPLTSSTLRAFPAPRCDENGFAQWSTYVSKIGALLERYCREVEFVAAVPLAVDEAALRTDPGIAGQPLAEQRQTIARRMSAARDGQRTSAGAIQTAFVQLVYPWLRTRESSLLPGDVEAPDGMLAGILAANALSAGTWRSVAHRPVSGLIDLEPVLTAAERHDALPYSGKGAQQLLTRTFQERITIFAPAPSGFELISDVTTDDDEAYRPANINRLVASIVRAARVAGEDAVFTNNGAALWRRLQTTLEEILLELWGDGALAGATASDAFNVRCDTSTMTQADIDEGRAIVRVEFTASSPVEQILVTFAMDEGGQVTLVHTQAAEPAGSAS